MPAKTAATRVPTPHHRPAARRIRTGPGRAVLRCLSRPCHRGGCAPRSGSPPQPGAWPGDGGRTTLRTTAALRRKPPIPGSRTPTQYRVRRRAAAWFVIALARRRHGTLARLGSRAESALHRGSRAARATPARSAGPPRRRTGPSFFRVTRIVRITLRCRDSTISVSTWPSRLRRSEVRTCGSS
jgi:hypothetical protein